MPTDQNVKPSVEEVVSWLQLISGDTDVHPADKWRLTQAADLLSSLEARALTAEARLAEAATPAHDGRDWLIDETAVNGASIGTGLRAGIIRSAVRAYYDRAFNSEKAAARAIAEQQGQ